MATFALTEDDNQLPVVTWSAEMPRLPLSAAARCSSISEAEKSSDDDEPFMLVIVIMMGNYNDV